MATYYSSPGSERESQDMYSRDPGNASYPMSSALGNLLYLNNNPSSGPYTAEFGGILQTQQNFMEMPGHGHHPAMSQDSSARESHDMLASHHGQRPFGHVKDMKDEMLMHMMDGARSGGGELIHDDPHNGAQFEFGVLNNHDSSDVPVGQGQGLSLSLNTQILAPSLPYWSIKPDMLTPNSYQESLRIDDIRMKNMQSEASRAIRHSRYLKAAQEVLDEVVNVWKNIKRKAQKEQAEPGKADGKESDGGPKSEGASQESGANAAPELSTAEKQELQNKMAKLMAMLDEVDRKYKHYYHQMQNVVASFDMVAGPGSAKPYTAVALQTISRHFRCLKDAINDQINVIRKKLGEEENSSGKEGKLTRLRYIDQQLRQQRAFQQYGMIPQNAWRPQRGLPENSVTVLRAWLFEHFLHPYPKDSEKLMLARQTGLTRSQISNWFINARVRLWKPMIEDMYKEETGDLEQDSNSSSDNVPRSKNKVASSEENEDLKNARARVCETSQLSESRASIGTMIVGAAPVGFQHAEANPDDSFMNLMMKEQRSGEADGGLLLHNAVAQHSDENARFMAYHLAELGRYGNGNVSLTLGLQHPGSGLSVPNAQAHFPGVGDDDIYNAGAPLGVGIASSDYESLNFPSRLPTGVSWSFLELLSQQLGIDPQDKKQETNSAPPPPPVPFAGDRPPKMLPWIFSRKGASGFSWASTADQVTAGISAAGLTAIVTGASSGIGAETARVLAARGAHVVMAARNLAAAEAVRQVVLAETPGASLDLMEMDLSSLASVRKFAADFAARGLPLNILINNAGVMATPFSLSKDGIEMQFATNHVGMI